MRAITIHEGAVEFRGDAPEPISAPGEILIEVIQAGICETDLQLARGYMGFSGTLGHEFVGLATSGRFAGRRVVGEINCNCGACPRCKAGLGNHCGNRTVIGIDRHDGAFAQRIAIPEQNLHSIPDSVSNDEAVFVEPLAAALQIAEQVELSPSTKAAVLGDGRLGYLSAQAIKLSTCDITVIGKHASKLARFEAIGITASKLEQSTSVDLRDAFDVVVDCTGSPNGLSMALNLVRPRGTVVMKTTVASEHRLSLASIVIDEITVVGSRCGRFDNAIRALEKKSIDVSHLITHRFPLESAHQAMQVAVSPDAFKVIFAIKNESD